MNIHRARLLLVTAISLSFWATTSFATEPTHFAGVHNSQQCLFIYGMNITIRGVPAQPGDEVAVFTQSGILCGATVLEQAGTYPSVSVYADDPATPATVDGARPNEPLTFRIWDASENTEYAQDNVLVTFAEKTNEEGQPYWTSNSDVYKVDLAALNGDTDETISLVIHPGWNLLSLPFNTVPGQGPKNILKGADGTTLFSGTVWRWDSLERNYVEVTDHFVATQGFWIYCHLPEQATTKTLTGAAHANTIAMDTGWNLFGPVQTARRSEIPGMTEVLKVYRWDAENQVFEALDAETTIKRGEGYWGYSGE